MAKIEATFTLCSMSTSCIRPETQSHAVGQPLLVHGHDLWSAGTTATVNIYNTTSAAYGEMERLCDAKAHPSAMVVTLGDGSAAASGRP